MFFQKFTGAIRTCLKKLDLFPTNQFIRYNKQSQYTTATGGFVSLGLIIIILILFSSRGIQIMNRSLISSSISSHVDTEPLPIKISTSPKGGFMFAIGIFGVNLNDPMLTYFSISLLQNYFSPILQVINSTQVPLVQCTQDHFAFNEDILQQYKKFNLPYSLCPPIGYEFGVGGKVSSQIFSQFTLNVQKCNSSVVFNCADDAIIAAIMANFGQFTLGIPILNTIVNPNDQEYLTQFVEDRNYFTFTPSYGILAKAEIAQYQINTDVSILPYQDIRTVYINTIPSLFYSRPVPVSNNLYAQLIFTKSSSSLTYSRSFSKLDDYFSYIGGLIGSAMALFFMLKTYSESSFFVELASNLLVIEDTTFSFRSFHIFSFIGIMFKRVMNFIGIKVPWMKGDCLIRSIDEIKEQLDICLLIKRVSFLQEAVSSVLSEHQIDALCLKDKRPLQRMRKWREKYKLAEIMNGDYVLKCEGQESSSVSLNKQEIINDSSYQCYGDKIRKQLFDKMKISINKVISQAKQNDVVSERIAQRMDPLMLYKVYQLQSNRIQIELKFLTENSALSSSKAHRISQNAIYNDFHASSKQKGQDLIIQNVDL